MYQRACGNALLKQARSPHERCKAMNTTRANFLVCFALFVLVVALTIGALMLVVPWFTHELTPSGYY